ncbi:MAG: 5-(carboxyamino)imidazole ribonucleotide synthase [Candidatus Obscuribacterales bacterium]
MRKIGILGGGQLGAMLAESVAALGGEPVIYDPDREAPAVKRARTSFNAPFDDEAAVRRFFEAVDVVTYEFENVEVGPLKAAAGLKPILPSIDVLAVTQNRINEKTFLRDNGLPHARFIAAESVGEFRGKLDQCFYPSVLKTARGGYDGKGQYFCSEQGDLEKHLAGLEETGKDPIALELEEFIEIAMEASCIVARPAKGKPVSFPIFENIHKDHILDLTLVPARLPASVQETLADLAIRAAERLDVLGLLTTEFFLSRSGRSSVVCDDWRIYINEFAPRPHNSGHVTRNACHMSQFDAHARILMDVPLGDPGLVNDSSWCMANLLGDTWLDQGSEPDSPMLDLSALSDHPEIVDVYIYGKQEARRKRKMGHLVSTAATPEEALASASRFKEILSSTVRTYS